MTTKNRKTRTMKTGECGLVADVFSQLEIENLLDRLSKLPRDHLYYTAINREHLLYSWFNKKVFSRLCDIVDQPMKMLFGGLIHEDIPQQLHSDYYYKSIGEPYKAFLIPVAIENEIKDLNRVHTIVFNESDMYVDNADPVRKMWKRAEWNVSKTPKENNALAYFDQHLSHLKPDDLECLTVDKVIPWELGGVVYWDEKKLHCSDNFSKNNIKSKQAIVIHTYVL